MRSGPQITDVCEFLQQNVSWTSLFTMIHCIGDSLDGRKDRFDKAELIERGLAYYSNNTLLHVDQIGADHFVPSLGINLEVKFSRSSIFTGKKKIKRNTVVKLTNSLGSSHDTEVKDTFDFLLIIDKFGCGVIDYHEVKNHVYSNGDGLIAKIPTNQLSICTTFDEEQMLNVDGVTGNNYKEQKCRAMDSFLENFKV